MLIRIHSTLRQQAGLRALTMDLPTPPTVLAALAALSARLPSLSPSLFAESGQARETFVVFCNGRQIIFLQGLETLLTPGDTLDLFPKSHLQAVFASD